MNRQVSHRGRWPLAGVARVGGCRVFGLFRPFGVEAAGHRSQQDHAVRLSRWRFAGPGWEARHPGCRRAESRRSLPCRGCRCVLDRKDRGDRRTVHTLRGGRGLRLTCHRSAVQLGDRGTFVLPGSLCAVHGRQGLLRVAGLQAALWFRVEVRRSTASGRRERA